jgi:hypothetical protein
MFSTTAFIILFVRILVVLTCLAVLSINRGIKPSSAGAYLYIVNNYFPYWLKIISILGMLFLVMSSIDSVLNAGSVLLTRNILKPLYLKRDKQINELSVVKYVSVILGVFAIFMALVNTKEIRTLVNIGPSLLGPSLVVPFIAGVFGFRSNQMTFIISTLISALSFVFISIFTDFTQDFIHQPIMYGLGFVSFITVHVALCGWNFTFDKICCHSESKDDFGEYGINYVRLGIFVCSFYLLPHFIKDEREFVLVSILRLLGIILCVGLMMKSYWKQRYSKYFEIYSDIVLVYCFPFMSMIFYLLNNNSREWAIVIGLSIMIISSLVSWRKFLVICFIGFLTSLVFTKLYFKQALSWYLDNFLYLCLIALSSITVSYCFFRKKALRFDQIIDNKYTYLSVLSRDLSIGLRDVFAEEERKRKEEEKLQMNSVSAIDGINRISKHINKVTHKVIRHNKRNLIKKLAGKIIYKLFD